MSVLPIETARLVLRRWRDSDRAPFARLNMDPEVMRYFASPGTVEGSNEMIDRWSAQIEEQGWSNAAVERKDTGEFIGFVGLSVPRRELPFTPCVEIGWRLAREHWGQGFATEAAIAMLRAGFERVGLEEIVSFTSIVNEPSRRVMERIGMTKANEDFDHPAIPEGSELRRHCLYRLTRDEWARKVIPINPLRSG